jgi:hypothetical protein
MIVDVGMAEIVVEEDLVIAYAPALFLRRTLRWQRLDVCDLMEVDRRGSLISPAAPVTKQSHFPVEVFLL